MFETIHRRHGQKMGHITFAKGCVREGYSRKHAEVLVQACLETCYTYNASSNSTDFHLPGNLEFYSPHMRPKDSRYAFSGEQLYGTQRDGISKDILQENIHCKKAKYNQCIVWCKGMLTMTILRQRLNHCANNRESPNPQP